MNFKQRIFAAWAIAGTLVAVSQGWALEPWKFVGTRNCWPNCVGKVCCDDYHGKPLPCAVGAKCFECPDYCRKPLPCTPPVKAFCCDDYCPKRLPPVCCPGGKNLRCVPSRLPPVKTTDRKASASAVTIPSTNAATAALLPVSTSSRRR